MGPCLLMTSYCFPDFIMEGDKEWGGGLDEDRKTSIEQMNGEVKGWRMERALLFGQ